MYQVLPVTRLPEGNWVREALERNGATEFTAIVSVGLIGDLACYVLAGDMRPGHVMNGGDKVDEATARAIYPALGAYRK